MRRGAAAAWLLLGCGSQTNNYVTAAAALGTTVLGTAVYRSVTHECWAQCRPGFVCDRSRGLCIRAECAPGCPVSQHCVRELDGSFSCVSDFGTLPIGSVAAPLDAGAPASDAGAGPN